MQIIDQHCSIENEDENIKSGGGVKSEYDFIYLPMDFRYYLPHAARAHSLGFFW